MGMMGCGMMGWESPNQVSAIFTNALNMVDENLKPKVMELKESSLEKIFKKKAELQIAREKMEAERAARAKARAKAMGVDLLAEAAALLSEAASAEAEAKTAPADEAAEAAEVEEETAEPAAEEAAVAAEPATEPEADLETPAAPDEPVVETPVTDGVIPSILESLVAEEPAKTKKKAKKRLKLVIAEEEITEVDPVSKKRGKSKARRLEYDENLGKVVVKRQRKKSRVRGNWEDYLD